MERKMAGSHSVESEAPTTAHLKSELLKQPLTSRPIARNSLPRAPFSLIIWGVGLALFDLSINGFDLFNDSIGFVLLTIGASGLAAYSTKFATVRILSLVSLALWFVACFVPPRSFLQEANSAASVLAICLLVWQLLSGFSELASRGERPDIAETAELYRLLFVAIYGVLFLFRYAPSILTTFPMAIGSLLAVFVLIFLILLISLKTKHAFAIR